jgi:hypothetical protein
MGKVIRPSMLLIFLILLWMPSAVPQGPDIAWLRTYGGHWGRSVRQTFDGGYIVVGKSSDFGEPYGDVFLIRTNANGDTLWIRTYGGAGPDQGYSVRQTSDGGFIIAGQCKAYYYADADVYLIRTDADGDTLWTRTFGGSGDEIGKSVWQTSDGGFVVGGHTNSYGAGASDAYLIRVDEDGDTLWTRTYGGAGKDDCDAVQETFDGNLVALGSTESWGPGWNAVYLIKTDASGDVLWTRTYGGDSGDYGRDVQETTDHGYIIVGETGSFAPYGIYLVRTDADGDTIWTRAYGESDAQAVEQTYDGGYVAVGATWFPCGMEVHCANIYVVKTDPAGEVEWTDEYGGADDDVADAIQQTSDGGYILAGFTESYEGGHILLLRLEGDLAGGGPLTDRGGCRFRVTIMPNPSNAGVSVYCSIERSAHVRITVHDLLGRKVRTILNKRVNPGRHAAIWDGTDYQGDYVQSGVYFCRVQTAAYAETRKVILAR